LNSRGMTMRHPSSRCRTRWILLALLAGWTGGCDLSGRPRGPDRQESPQSQISFANLFQQNCAGCHGADGKLGPAPPLNDRLFLALIPVEELHRVITRGRPGTLMPAFAGVSGGPLTAEQVGVLAAGIKRSWGPAQPAGSDVPPYLVTHDQRGKGAPGNKEEGLEVFARACASCHGDHGQGGHDQDKDKPVGAINDPDYLALISDQALRRFVITGRPDLGMPDHADPTGRPSGFKPLSCQDVINVTALLASWRQAEPIKGQGD
jgi:cytochrome c oxidase cbb3-type subunit 3